jgi:hypothetical protein
LDSTSEIRSGCTEAFLQGVGAATADDGRSFEKYRRDAQSVYRKKDKGAQKDLPVVPQEGLPKPIQSQVFDALVPDPANFRMARFEWSDFESGDLFAVDSESETILLNVAFRKYSLRGLPSSNTDLLFSSLMIFFLARSDYDR